MLKRGAVEISITETADQVVAGTWAHSYFGTFKRKVGITVLACSQPEPTFFRRINIYFSMAFVTDNKERAHGFHPASTIAG